jgi:transcription antitermination factor NusG
VISSLAHPQNRELETVASSEELLPGNSFWHAIRVQSKFAKVTSTALHGKGHEEFLPLCRSKRRWSDRIKQLELPLFPGYLFCRFSVSDSLMPILTTPGVIGIVGAGNTPVHAQEIEAVRAILRSGLAAQSWPFLRAGSDVYIERGPLAGMDGIVSNADKVDRLQQRKSGANLCLAFGFSMTVSCCPIEPESKICSAAVVNACSFINLFVSSTAFLETMLCVG